MLVLILYNFTPAEGLFLMALGVVHTAIKLKIVVLVVPPARLSICFTSFASTTTDIISACGTMGTPLLSSYLYALAAKTMVTPTFSASTHVDDIDDNDPLLLRDQPLYLVHAADDKKARDSLSPALSSLL
jgi:hypothetical protein